MKHKRGNVQRHGHDTQCASAASAFGNTQWHTSLHKDVCWCSYVLCTVSIILHYPEMVAASECPGITDRWRPTQHVTGMLTHHSFGTQANTIPSYHKSQQPLQTHRQKMPSMRRPWPAMKTPAQEQERVLFMLWHSGCAKGGFQRSSNMIVHMFQLPPPAVTQGKATAK